MIIPTAEFDPMFADDGVPFRIKMVRYLEREFAGILGPRVMLLHSDEGLETLSRTYVDASLSTSRQNNAA
jgi:hypothetical protein